MPVEQGLPQVTHEDEAARLQRATSVKQPERSIALQVWLDLAADSPGGLAHRDIPTELCNAIDALVQVARARCGGFHDEVSRLLRGWAKEVAGDRTSESADHDVRVERFASGTRTVVVALRHRWERTDAPKESWTVQIAAGPDRYGIRLQVMETARRGAGEAPFANEPSRANFSPAIRQLSAACAQLDVQISQLDDKVSEALAATAQPDVTDLLAERRRLLTEFRALERRRRSFRGSHELLADGWCAEAFEVDPRLVDELQVLGITLQGLRVQLVEIPQLVLADASHRQAQRTEGLTVAAAALVPPTLVAGVLGANVLPWNEGAATWPALLGMILLMVASGAGAIVAVQQYLLRSRVRSSITVALTTMSVLLAVAGVVLLLCGTVENGG